MDCIERTFIFKVQESSVANRDYSTETIPQEFGRPHVKLSDTVNSERDGIRWGEDCHENTHQGYVAGFAIH